MLRLLHLALIALIVASFYALQKSDGFTHVPVRAEQRSVTPAAATASPASLAAFKQRVDAYVKLRKDIAKDMPEVKETGDPKKISEREKKLGDAIAMARSSAKAGDIIGDLAPYLSRILAEDWNSRTEAEKKGLLEEIPPNLVLKVNQAYPTTIPLVSVPGKLLAQLPMLPEEVEYRIVDRRLLLRDRDANVIVDVLPGAPPSRDR